MPSTTSVDRVVEAWELYSAGSYAAVAAMTQDGDVGVLAALSRLETEPGFRPPAGSGLFAVLLDGMAAFHRSDTVRASKLLGAWLEKKSYFTPLVLERFLNAAESAEDYRLLHTTGRRFLDRKQYHRLLIAPLFRAAFQLERYKDCAALFDAHRQSFRDPLLLHKTALALMYTGRHGEAEQILLAIYRKMTGRAYALDYDRVAEEYAPLIRQIPELEKRKKRDTETDWQLGMAYLFNRQFDRALQIFNGLQRSAA